MKTRKRPRTNSERNGNFRVQDALHNRWDSVGKAVKLHRWSTDDAKPRRKAAKPRRPSNPEPEQAGA